MNTIIPKNVLIVDDHPMTVDSYISLLSNTNSFKEANFYTAHNAESAYTTIKKIQSSNANISYAFLDVNVPAWPEKKILNGIDLAELIKGWFQNCKIIIITMHNEPLWVNRIIKSIKPDGFISKNEVNYKTFPQICEKIVVDESYYSESIIESQRFLIKKNINWDEHDSKILQLIAEGKKTIHLTDYIPLSLSAIEKRKACIKKQLIFESGQDKELIEVAKKLGLI